MSIRPEVSIKNKKLLVHKCHVCDHVMESPKEMLRCERCHKAFMPLQYFYKIHENTQELTGASSELFIEAQELSEEDLIIGLYAIW